MSSEFVVLGAMFVAVPLVESVDELEANWVVKVGSMPKAVIVEVTVTFFVFVTVLPKRVDCAIVLMTDVTVVVRVDVGVGRLRHSHALFILAGFLDLSPVGS